MSAVIPLRQGQREHLRLVKAPAKPRLTLTGVPEGEARDALQALLKACGFDASELTAIGAPHDAGIGSCSLHGTGDVSSPAQSASLLLQPVLGLPGYLPTLQRGIRTLFLAVADEATPITPALPLLRALSPAEPVIAVLGTPAPAALDVLEPSDIEWYSPTSGAFALLQQRRKPAIVVGSKPQVELLAAAAHAVSGTGPMAASIGFEGNTWTTTTDNQVLGSDAPPTPAAIIMNLVLGLLAIRADEAATRLHNALLLAIEGGFHPEALPLAQPYTRALDDAAFYALVERVLGEVPRRLEAVDYRGETTGGVRSQADLTLVP